MDTVTIRELRNHGGDVVDRVEAGEHVTVTRDGRPVAELRPVRSRGIAAVALLERWRHLPSVEADALRRDVDAAIDSVGPLVATDDAERARRLAHVQQAEADFDPVPFRAAAAHAFGIVALGYRRSGRKPAARAFDALIAATAIAYGLPLYTANPADFAGIDGLVVRTIPTPGTAT